MAEKARNVQAPDGTYQVLVYSETNREILGFNVLRTTVLNLDDQGNGGEDVFKHATQFALPQHVIEEFNQLLNYLTPLMQAKDVQYDGNSCPDSTCLLSSLGFGEVTTWLTS